MRGSRDHLRGGVGAGLTGVLLLAACGGGAKTAPTGSGFAPESRVLSLAAARFPPAPAAEQTQPSVAPAVGTTTTRFQVRFTARQRLGANGPVRYDYRIILQGVHPRCAVFTEVTVAARDERVSTILRPPFDLGWCIGPYRALVVLDTSPHCLPPQPGSPACTLFATRSLDAGRFSFSAR